MGLFRNIKKHLTDRSDQRIWDNMRPSNPNWMRKAQVSLNKSYLEKDRAYIYKADRLSRDFFEEGRYEEAAELRENAAKIAIMYPDTEKYAEEEMEMAKKIKDKARERDRRSNGLEGKAYTAIAIGGLIGGLFFLSPNLTGNAILLNQSTGNILGSVLLVAGLMGCFLLLRGRK